MADLPRRSASRPSVRSLEDDEREAGLDAWERAADKRDRDPNNAGVSVGPGPRGPVQNGQASHVRDADASERDTLAEGRDDEAVVRDAVAASRDVHAMGVITEQPETPPSALLRTIAQLQTSSGADRRQAGADRRLSARDRADSLADRVASGQDRTLAAAQRESAIHDDLTGTLRREQGLFQLDQEIERAARGAGLLCFAFVDVDGLKVVNDSLSRQAGDEVLRRVCDALRAHLRPYDSIVRYGGDEFVCGLPGLTIKEVQVRFAAIEVTLAQGAVSASVTTGLAMCESGDTVNDLIGRADADLHRQRERRNQRGWRM